MTTTFAVDIEACRSRQQRLLAEFSHLDIEYALLTNAESVQWLTGAYYGPAYACAAAMDQQGSVTVICPDHAQDQSIAADDIVSFNAQILATFTENQPLRCMEAFLATLRNRPQHVGGEFSSLNRHWTETWQAHWVDIGPTLLRLRRRKDPDELQRMAYANEANRAMFEYARENIHPGIHELDLYNSLHAVAVKQLGEPLTYFGHDFQCASPGGPPRDRSAAAGELYILDLGVGFRGYRSDNSRTFSVDKNPTEAQQKAWSAVKELFALVESTVKPGVSCSQLYHQVQELLSPQQPWKFEHHLGHGVGLSPHETPRLNPQWDDSFEKGDFFTIEPGLYHADLAFGLRQEQNYLVTEKGVQLLTDWLLEL